MYVGGYREKTAMSRIVSECELMDVHGSIASDIFVSEYTI